MKADPGRSAGLSGRPVNLLGHYCQRKANWASLQRSGDRQKGKRREGKGRKGEGAGEKEERCTGFQRQLFSANKSVLLGAQGKNSARSEKHPPPFPWQTVPICELCRSDPTRLHGNVEKACLFQNLWWRWC